MEKIEKEFNKIQSIFNKGKQYLLGEKKNIKLSIENYVQYFNELNNIYESLKNNSKEIIELNNINSTYISYLIKLAKTFLLIPYFYKAKLICEKIIELDKNNIDIIPTYIKCLHHFGEYSQITNVLNNIQTEKEIIKELKIKNEERIKESKGEYDLKKIYLLYKKDKNYNLELAEYKSYKFSLQQDKVKGLILVSNEEIQKGELLMASRQLHTLPN